MDTPPVDASGWPQDARRVRCLLLTSALGLGHVRAAQNIESALRRLAPAATIDTVDFWSLMNPGVANAIRRIYLRLVQERAQVYEQIYQLDERTWRDVLEADEPPASVLQLLSLIDSVRADRAALEPRGGPYLADRMLFPMLCAVLPGQPVPLPANGAALRLAIAKIAWQSLSRRLERKLRKLQPDVVISTQMVPAALLADLKRRQSLDVPSIGVVTDFGLHDFWRQPQTDLYCVGHESLVPGDSPCAARSIATGVPLGERFTVLPSQRHARHALGLESGACVALVLGGGLGLGVESMTNAVLAARRDLRVIAVAGRNDAALDQLQELARAHPERLAVTGWTDHMEVLLRASDLVVGKPGGLTVAECLAAGRPLLATGCLHGQEGHNVRFIERHGVGRLVDPADLTTTLADWLARPELLAAMQARAARLGRQDGARHVARRALALCRPASAQAA